MSAVLVDAGPLIALLDRGDAHHHDCVGALAHLSGPLRTVWPAFTEAMYLLSFSRVAQTALWEMVESEVLEIAPLASEGAPRIKALMRKYSDLPMDLADAALVRVAERERIARVFTLDRRHFRVYKPSGITLSIVP